MKRLITSVVAAVVVVAAAAILPAGAFGAPAHDNFASATVIQGSGGGLEGGTFGATKEAGEPAHAGIPGGASVWYRWVAPADGFAYVTVGSWGGFDSLLAAYTGTSVDALTEIASNDDWYGLSSRIVFPTVEGTEYWIAVDGYNGKTGGFDLRWWMLPPPPANDDFADALLLEGLGGAVEGSNVSATEEPGEPAHAPWADASVWYRWTAPSTGHIRFQTEFGTGNLEEVDSVLAVYTGTSLDALTLVAQDYAGLWTLSDARKFASSAVSFRAIAGTTYSVAVVGDEFWGWDLFTLRWFPGAIITGTGKSEVLRGTAGRDFIDGGGGNDTVYGLTGNDAITGYLGADRLYGGRGNDLIFGDLGADRLYGGPGRDRLNSRDYKRGNDAIYGGTGSDTARADRGDLIRGVP